MGRLQHLPIWRIKLWNPHGKANQAPVLRTLMNALACHMEKTLPKISRGSWMKVMLGITFIFKTSLPPPRACTTPPRASMP